MSSALLRQARRASLLLPQQSRPRGRPISSLPVHRQHLTPQHRHLLLGPRHSYYSTNYNSRRAATASASVSASSFSFSLDPSSYLLSQQQALSTPAASSLWWARVPPPGSGFDNFRNPAKSRSNSNNQKTGNDSGNDNNKNNNDNNNRKNDTWFWFSAAATGVLLALLTKSASSSSSGTVSGSGSGSGSGALSMSGASTSDDATMAAHQHQTHPKGTITWGEFSQLLQQRDVVKILIDGNGMGRDGSSSSASDNLTARVYVRANAIGLTASSPSSYEALRQRRLSSGATATESDHASLEHHHDESDSLLHRMGSGDATSIATGTGGSSMTVSSAPLFYRLPIGSVDSFERKLDDAQRALHRDPSQDVPIQYTAPSTFPQQLLSIVPGLVIAGGLYVMLRMGTGGMGAGMPGGGRGGAGGGGGGIGGIFQIGKSTHKRIQKEDIAIRFKDVAGCDEAKKEIMEFVDFLKDSQRFTKLGAKIPKGALLCGPPGTGKTLLAKAVAGEAGVPFYSISGSDFIEMFVGVGPSRVRDLFQEARANAPCIVFIDEIDAVGRQRGRGGMGGNDERENTLNQLLVEMDGFEPSTGVVVLAGTNRVDILDQALTRPGRFDRQITVDKPDLQGRRDIFKVHLEGIKLEDDVEDIAGRLAGLTPGFAGADIANICNEAAIVAARRKGETVTLADFEKATDRIVGGLESNKIMSKEERSIVAHHEAGHAIAGWFLEHADPLLKVTIIPRASGALGFAQYLPKEVYLRTKDQIMDIVCMALAGRASEEIFFGRATTGASDDLKRVTQLVYSTIQLYGMNQRLGQLSFPRDPNAFFEERPYSEKTAKAMDEEARAMVEGAYQRTVNLLREKRREVELVAQMLLEKETVTHTDVVDLIGPRPFRSDPAYDEYIQRKAALPKDDGEASSSDAGPQPANEDGDLGPLNPGLA